MQFSLAARVDSLYQSLKDREQRRQIHCLTHAQKAERKGIEQLQIAEVHTHTASSTLSSVPRLLFLHSLC